jgi:4-hydroxybenzoate polyprenyltransferase
MALLRTLLVVGRISNLPTLWSNCLAGWWLGGVGDPEQLPLLVAGASLLYLGGMFLNDAFDAQYDRHYRPERPIPAGDISLTVVWRWGLIALGLGGASLIFLGRVTGALGVALLLLIVLYNAFHKQLVWAPILMAACRFLVYVIAASIAANGVTGWALWGGLALAFYIAGLSFLARREATPGLPDYWPLLLLAAPIVLALFMNGPGYRLAAGLLGAALAFWVVSALSQSLWSDKPNVGRTVSWLLAGVVLVDWLAVADAPRQIGFVFIGLFLSALLLQRVVPAT